MLLANIVTITSYSYFTDSWFHFSIIDQNHVHSGHTNTVRINEVKRIFLSLATAKQKTWREIIIYDLYTFTQTILKLFSLWLSHTLLINDMFKHENMKFN